MTLSINLFASKSRRPQGPALRRRKAADCKDGSLRYHYGACVRHEWTRALSQNPAAPHT